MRDRYYQKKNLLSLSYAKYWNIMAKLVTRPFATTSLRIRIESGHPSKIISERHNQRSVQHIESRKKYTTNYNKYTKNYKKFLKIKKYTKNGSFCIKKEVSHESAYNRNIENLNAKVPLCAICRVLKMKILKTRQRRPLVHRWWLRSALRQ